MATTTRTLNPLPFQDLEPKRFEDLSRQLLYDFRNWQQLEATGRAGTDDGFDARGIEVVGAVMTDTDDVDGIDDGEREDADVVRRLWLVQCKREKSISPAKMVTHLEKINLDGDDKLYGIIFVASCDFSKKTRDAFLAWARRAGIAEAYLWGKGELEDLLFQPKNDHLLFAYFGISLSIRRRNQSTELRSLIATKRKLTKLFKGRSESVLLRLPDATAYPENHGSEWSKDWRAFWVEGIIHSGLQLCSGWSYAYIDGETGEWDAVDALRCHGPSDPWEPVESQNVQDLKAAASKIWEAIPEGKKGWLHVFGVLHFKDIIAIDEMGDDIFPHPHIYVARVKRGSLLDPMYIRLVNNDKWANEVYPDPEKRINHFGDGGKSPQKN